MCSTRSTLLTVLLLFGLLLPTSATFAQPPDPSAPAPQQDTVSVTILHTNDFHGNLEPSGSNPGVARLATKITEVRTSVGVSNTLLLDGGDIMQGSLLSNLKRGEPTIDLFNFLGYAAATPGNHEFDWGQSVLISRTQQAQFPFVAANLVVSDTNACETAGWTHPAFVKPWVIKNVGPAGNQVPIGIIGVTSLETPFITIASATQGLCFKDPAESIKRYYDEVRAAGAKAIVVLSHNGFEDGGYGYGFTVYGDKTLAKKLLDAGKPANLIIGGHSHTDLSAAVVVTSTAVPTPTTVVQAHYAGRKLGRADLTINKATGAVSVTWQRIVVDPVSTPPDTNALAKLAVWTNDSAYQAQINQVIGYTAVDLETNYNGESLMGNFIQDAIYNDLNSDSTPANDVDMVFNNAGGIRASITGTVQTNPLTLTYGALFSVLPFGNATAVGTMTGAQIVDLLNQSATLAKGALQPGGIRYSFYAYTDTLTLPQPWAWGAFDITVRNRTNGLYEPILITKTYRVATNEFLAPAGQDLFTPFKYMTNISYWGDMLDGVNRWVAKTYTITNPYTATLDGRIKRVGDSAGGPIVPVTVLHHNDPHGNLTKGAFVGYTQLATLIKQERARNPQRTILLNSGDTVQGDAMMYYFKAASLGYTADGKALTSTLAINPIIAAMNAMSYTAMTLGNHEFNFGNDVFTSTLRQANFPNLQANLYDDGRYGLAKVPIRPDLTLSLPGPTGTIKLAILGIGNHRVPNYELPSNILGLTFTDPITEAKVRAPLLKAVNDVVVALTHIGFTTNPKSVEVDNNVDTYLATQAAGIDAIIGGHSHTDPTKQTDASGEYKYLPAFVGGPGNVPVIINHAYRYNSYLGQVVLGLRPKVGGGYEVVARAGRSIPVTATTPEDAQVKAIVDPYTNMLNAYNGKVLGTSSAPIDATEAFTRETNGANLQADASVWELARNTISVDFHLSGAMSNRAIASKASASSPVTLTVGDMFTAMPYENSLVVLRMNGPQLKAVLERGYRNYYYYKYVPGYGGYSYYTTCMLDINAGGRITYRDTYPLLPNGDNVESLVVNGRKIDFNDAQTYYRVSTVNYLAAGSCNFNDGGKSLWPLNQIANDTQYYVRDAVINYIAAKGAVAPAIEGRLKFQTGFNIPMNPNGGTLTYTDTKGIVANMVFPSGAFSQSLTLFLMPIGQPPTLPPGKQVFVLGFDLDAVQGTNVISSVTFGKPVTVTIRYNDTDMAGLSERHIQLLFWNGSAWADASCGAYQRNLAENTFSVPVCHLSRFGAFTTPQVYMPVAAKN